MLNSLRDGQINYGTTNCPSAHVPPHNVVAPIHQNSLHSTEPSTPVVYPWNSNPRFEHLYGFHSRYYNLDFPSPYPHGATNQYVPANIYGQNVSQCCQPCCRLRSQNIPKTSPPQMLYNPIRPVKQLNRSYKSKKTLKTPCSEQFLPYIANNLPVKYDTQNCYQQKYGTSYLNNSNYCPPTNNLWIPPATNSTWPADRLRPVGHHTSVTSHDFSREKSYPRLQHYQTNPYSNPNSSTHHRPYNYIPPIPDVQSYRPPVYHNSLKNNASEYVPHDSRLPISSQINQSPTSLQQYYNAQPVPYSDVQRPSESFKSSQVTPQNSSKSNLNVREFLANWDEGEEEICEKSSETTAPIVVLDCMTLEGDALTKIQEKLNVVSYENLEKVLKENNNPLVINTESSEIDSISNKAKPPSKPNFEPIDYTKRETGIIKPFITEKKRLPTTNTESDKNYSVNFDGMVAWYGKKNADISSTDLIERLADRIFNLSKSQENDGVSFGTAAYTGQITQTNRSVASSVKDSSKYLPNQHMYGLQDHTEKFIEPSVINKIDYNNDSMSRIHSSILNESKKASTIKSNNINSSCIVENITKKCLNVTNEETVPWNLDQGTQEQHLNMSLYDHSVIIKPLDFSSLTDETKCNPFVFEKNTSNSTKSNNSINDQFNKVLNENNNYNPTVTNNQQIDSTNRNFPVIVSPHVHRQEYNGLHESVIQRTGCDKNKHDKVSTQTDFESMNWSLSNDIDKIMKNTNISMEPSCLYDRNNYNILDSMNSDKNVPNQWKDNVPCVDLTVNSKTNNNHDSFFDSWNFIESYENHSSKKLINPHSNNNEVHNPLFSNQITSLDESNTKHNSSEKIENETLIPIKDIPNDVSSNNARSQDVFNLNNRIPDFSDGFELPGLNEPHDYIQFKKVSNDNERRTDGSIFEHLNETKCSRNVNEITSIKNDQNKPDIVGLPSFKEKEPLAPMLVPPKLNIVKPILRDPSQIYTVIKQKLKYDNTCIDNDSAVSNKTENNLRNPINFNVEDLKSKYNSVQLNQFDVWSEKFELKSNSNNSSSAVVHCDVEITQFKSNPETRNGLIPKPNSSENYQDKNKKLTESTNCNLTMDKMNVMENEKMNSNDFLNCLESTKTDDQKYRDTLDEFETSFGFDIHCNNESNKSFHEDIVDKCLEERIKDQIGEHGMNSTDSNTTPNTNITSSSTQLPFQCDFQSGYLIKNYFDVNKNKTTVFDRKQISNDEKSSKIPFNYHNEIEHNFEIQNNKNLQITQNSEKNSDYNILNNVNCGTGQIEDDKKNNSNFINRTEFKPSFELNHENSNMNKLSSTEKNNLNYLTIDNQNYEFENNKKNIIEPTESKEIIENKKFADNNDVCKISHSDSNIHKLSNNQEHSSVHFELNINNSNIFATNSNTASTEGKTETINLELQNIKNTFDSENSVNIKQHNSNTKNIYEIDNNNCIMYQTQNLEKMNEFDFETRIIQNFEMECSNSDVQGSTISKKVFTCENQMKTKYSLAINDEKNSQQVTIFKRTPSLHELHHIEKNSDIDCNDITKLDDVIEEKHVIEENKIDRSFKVDCDISNIQKEKTLEIHNDFDIQNKNEEITLTNCCSHENNINNKTEVENIFEKLYGNLTTLNTKKSDSDISDQCDQSYAEFDISKNHDNIEDSKNNDSVIADEGCEKIKIDQYHNEADETFAESDTVLLQEIVNTSASDLTPTLLRQKTILEKELTLGECDAGKLNKHTSNKNENVLDVSNINVQHEYTKDFEKQQSNDFQQDKIELMNQNNIQTTKNTTVNSVQSDNMKKMFENIKLDLLNAVKNTDITCDNEHNQNNNSGSSSLNHAKLICQQKPNIVEIENTTNSESSFLTHAELICSQTSSNFDIENSPKILSLLDHAKLTHQNSNKITEMQDSTRFESSLINSAEFDHQQNSEVEDSVSSKTILQNHAELTCLEDSNNIVEVKQFASSESSSLYHAELNCPQNSNNNIEVQDSASPESCSSNNIKLDCEVEDSSDSELSLSNKIELTYQQNYKNNDEVKDLASPRSNLSNHAEPACQENVNYNEVQDSASSESSSSNNTEFDCEVEDSSDSELSLSNKIELAYQQNYKNNDEIKDLASLRSNLSNHAEPASQENVNYNIEVQDSASSKSSSSKKIKLDCEVEDSSDSELSSSNHAELSYQQNFNNIDEVKDLASPRSNLSNHAEPACQENVNYNIEIQDSASSESSSSKKIKLDCEVEDSSDSELSSSNHAQLTYQQNFNNIDEVKDLTSPRSNMSNRDELPCQENVNYNIEVLDSASSESSSSNNIKLDCKVEDSSDSELSSPNNIELTHQQNYNNIDKVKDLASPRSNLSNHAEPACQENVNYNIEVQDSASSESISSDNIKFDCNVEDSSDSELSSPNNVELTHQQNYNNIDEVKDLASPRSNLSNYAAFTCQENVNYNIEVQDSVSLETSTSKNTEFDCRQNSNNNIEVENSFCSELSSSSHDKLTCQQNLNNIVGIENSVSPRPTSSLKHIKSTFNHSNNIVKVEKLTEYTSSSLHKTKSTYQQHPCKPIDITLSGSCKSNLLNHVELIHQLRSSEISSVEDSIGSGLGLLNDNTLNYQQHSDDIDKTVNLTSKKNSTFFGNNIPLPRVKFILKCHRKNMINSNIFDEESVVPLKKSNLLKDKKFISRQIFKNKNKLYKTCHSICRKESINEPEEIIKEVIETICSQIIYVDDIPQSIEPLCYHGRENENKLISSAELPCSNDKQYIEKSNYVEDDEFYINTRNNIVNDPSRLDELNTPIPSPFDDFQSENPTPEHYESEEYWDKSLENEYNDVLHKTISKLTKIRVNIRDKFDIRLLARRVNETKRRKWRRWSRQRRRLEKTKRSINDNVSDFVVGDIQVPAEVLTLNATTEQRTTNPICKIKVQLPWGRIFNLNNSRVEVNQKTKDTKLELGPAKVEVRLSQTPGEWQVAACESVTSSKSVVSVRRLVLQRASPTKEGYFDSCGSPSKNCDDDLNIFPKNVDEDCDSPAKGYNDDCKNPKESYYGTCDSPAKDNNNDCKNPTDNCDDNCTTISSSSSSSSSNSKDDSSSNNTSSSSRDVNDLKEHSRKLPKIVIRRIGQNNNYTSYVSSTEFEGGDKNDGTRQLMVRLVRDRKLDAMAAEGITTIHLKHNVPISESAADTHGAKRVRYT